MEAAGLNLIGVYIRKRKEAISERVACRPIYDMYTEAERIPETIRLVQWSEQDAVNEPEE